MRDVSWHMGNDRSTRDCRGNDVKCGDRVRVLSLSSQFLASLPGDEVDDVRSMVGETFNVETIDENGSAWVSKWWHSGESRSRSHSVGLTSAEMERVGERDAN